MLVWMSYAMLIGAFLVAAAFVADAALRGRGLPTRWAWSVAMIATVALPLLAFIPARTASAAVAVAANPVTPARGLPAVVDMQAPLRAASETALASPDYGRALVGGWALMSGAMLVCLALGATHLVRRRREWRDETVEGTEVLIAPDAGPAAVGLLRPRIVLPVWALDAERGALRLMLAHESEHVRARDPLMLGAASLLLAIMPWNPALWWQAARLRDAIELDCDARVLRATPEPRRYADVLLHVARGESRWLLASPGMARHRSLERRIRRLAGSRRWGRASLALAATAVVALVAVACGVERPAMASVAPAQSGSSVVAVEGSGSATPYVAPTAVGSGSVASVMTSPTPEARPSTVGSGVARRVSQSAANIRAAVAAHHPELLRRYVEGVGVWVIASPNGQVIRTGTGAPYRRSREVERALGDANGFEFASVLLTELQTDDGKDLPVAWAVLEEGVQVSVSPPSGGLITCSTRRDLPRHHLVIEMADAEGWSFVVSAEARPDAGSTIFTEARGDGFAVNCSGAPTVSLSGLPANGFEIKLAGDVREFEILIVRGESRHTMSISPGETLNSRIR